MEAEDWAAFLVDTNTCNTRKDWYLRKRNTEKEDTEDKAHKDSDKNHDHINRNEIENSNEKKKN